MGILSNLYFWLDAFLIFWYRIPDNPMLGFLLGTAALSFFVTVIGWYTADAAASLTKSHLQKLKKETVSMHNLSMKAIAVKDKASYTSCNKMANDAFGRYFFAQAGLGAAALLPVPFALGWLQERFYEVVFPIPVRIPKIGNTVTPILVFILLYILIRILAHPLRNRLLSARKPSTLFGQTEADDEKMLSLSDLVGPKPDPKGT